MKILSSNSILLCPNCGPTHCCPKFIKNDKFFIIEDDYNSSVKFKKEDVKKIIQDVDKILSLHRSSLDT